MKLRSVRREDVFAIDNAIALLKDARTRLRDAGARKAAAYVQRALKSAQGARNHADRAQRDAEDRAAEIIRAASSGPSYPGTVRP